MMIRPMMLMMFLGIGCVPKAQYDQLQKQNRQLKTKANAMANAQIEVYNQLKEDLSGPINRGFVELGVDQWGRIVVGLSSDILFEAGSASLSAEGRNELGRLGRRLAQNSDQVFRVEGHTDRHPIATEQFPNNWYLSSARAIVVVEHLIGSGLSPRQLSVGAHADNRPVGREDSENRRIEIIVEPNMTDMPGYQRLLDAMNEE